MFWVMGTKYSLIEYISDSTCNMGNTNWSYYSRHPGTKKELNTKDMLLVRRQSQTLIPVKQLNNNVVFLYQDI